MKLIKFINPILIYVICVLTLASCQSNQKIEAVVECTPTIQIESIDVDPTDVIPTTETPPNEDDQTQESFQIEDLPPLAINTAYIGDFSECVETGTAEIWIAESPFKKFNRLLSNDEINYYVPTWSPNGEWIAHIESKPVTVHQEFINTTEPGTDQVWITRPDGSEQRPISDPFPRLNSLDFNDYCMEYWFMYPRLSWSPSRFVIFAYIASIEPVVEWEYYIVDLETNKTAPLPDVRGNSPCTWSSDSKQLMMFDDRGVVIFKVESDGIIRIEKSIPSPIEQALEYGVWGSGNEQLTLLLSFYPEGILGDCEKEIWVMDIKSHEWKEVLTFNYTGIQDAEHSYVVFGNDFSLVLDYEGSMVYFIDLKTLEFSGHLPAETDQYNFYDGKFLLTSTNREATSFHSKEKDTNEIWLVDPTQDQLEAVRIIEDEDIPLEKDFFIYDYDWGK